MPTERPDPPSIADERTMVRTFLDFHRATLEWKCDGLTDDQLRRRSMPPSTLSLLGLVRHLTDVERVWFRIAVGKEQAGLVWSDEFDFQRAYDPTGCTRAEAFDAWHAEVEHSRSLERTAESLDVSVWSERWQEDVSLRMIMNHLVHEYARHSGHADLLREGIDGVTGA